MTTHINSIVKNTLLVVLCTALSLLSFSQKEKGAVIRPTKEQMDKINSIAEPIRKKLEEKLSKDETYARYQKDLRALTEMKNVEQRKAATKKIISNYESFFAGVWKNAGVDEKSYQTQIRSVFPAAMAEHITFQSNGGFSVNNPPPSTTPAPPPAPERGNICINDVCSKGIIGEVVGDNYLISGGGGNYGKCYVKAHAWGAVAAGGSLSTVLKHRLAIPGDFPQDGRRLQVNLEYDVKLEATAFAVLGLSVASASVSSRKWENSHYMMIFSPIIFANSRIEQNTVTTSYILDKSNLADAQFNAGSTVISAVISASWGNAEANISKWSICEIK
jgi:hypothetical protein